MNATTGLKAAARKFGPTKRYKTTKIDEELELALHEKWEYTLFSVQPLCTLCLCGSLLLGKNNHRDTEYTEVAQRRETPNEVFLAQRRKESGRALHEKHPKSPLKHSGQIRYALMTHPYCVLDGAMPLARYFSLSLEIESSGMLLSFAFTSTP